MIAEALVLVWTATFAYLMGRASTRRFRGRAQIGYLADPDERPVARPSLDFLLDTADPSVSRVPLGGGADREETAEEQFERHMSTALVRRGLGFYPSASDVVRRHPYPDGGRCRICGTVACITDHPEPLP